MFDGEIDYAMIHKIYGPSQEEERYSPGTCRGIEKRVVFGSSDESRISTSYLERQNLTMRMGMRWFTRLTNGFSQKVENLAHAVSLHYMHYNFARSQKDLNRLTPAEAAGVADHKWSVVEIEELLD